VAFLARIRIRIQGFWKDPDPRIWRIRILGSGSGKIDRIRNTDKYSYLFIFL